MTRSLIILGIISFQICNASGAPKYIPVVNGQLTTGQWYFEGERSSLGGNASLNFIPALKFSSKFSLLPSIETNYRGTRSADELAGGNTLFQDTWESAVGLKAIHRPSRKWTIRERIGARTKLFRETTDESLGDGLYDYRIYNAGAELERHWTRKFSTALGYDYSILKFPNYTSLESSQGPDLAREFSGNDVLDTNIHLVSFRSKFPFFFQTKAKFQGFYSPRNYTDQTVVINSGLLSSTKRVDTYTGATVGLERLLMRGQAHSLAGSVFYGYTGQDSNQNHYDARLTTFVSDFYDFDQQRYGANLSLAMGTMPIGPVIFDAGVSYTKRIYRHRLTQDNSGAYLTDNLDQVDTSASLGFSYPISKYFRFKARATFGRSRSNTHYEEVYRYNYNNSNYQFGVGYEY